MTWDVFGSYCLNHLPAHLQVVSPQGEPDGTWECLVSLGPREAGNPMGPMGLGRRGILHLRRTSQDTLW
jgi:hypothetical protein